MFKTAVLKGSYENEIAIRRNAKIDESKNYTDPIEVLQSVANKVVEIGLLDAAVATEYEKEMAQLQLRVHKLIDTNSGYGIVLSYGLGVIKDDVRDFVHSNRPMINEFVKQSIPLLYVSLFGLLDISLKSL